MRRGKPAGVVVLPRDPNPYQELLYSRMRAVGRPVVYGAELTRLRTLNILLLPLELMLLRLRGYRILHLHWVFNFVFFGADRWPRLRRLARLWFQLTLAIAEGCGVRIVWTAHNLLPQGRVFDNDFAARRFLVSHADLIIAHTRGGLEEVTAHFGSPSATAVIPHGPFEPPGLSAISPVCPAKPRRLLFFGMVEAYKGVEDLLIAVRAADAKLKLAVVGRCRDRQLEDRLRELAEGLEQVTLSLSFVEENDIARVFSEADAVVFPYRRVTTSGAVILAAVAGRPIIVPDLPGFANVPDTAAIRYQAGVGGLSRALCEFAELGPAQLRAQGEAAREMLQEISWESIADRTAAAFDELLT